MHTAMCKLLLIHKQVHVWYSLPLAVHRCKPPLCSGGLGRVWCTAGVQAVQGAGWYSLRQREPLVRELRGAHLPPTRRLSPLLRDEGTAAHQQQLESKDLCELELSRTVPYRSVAPPCPCQTGPSPPPEYHGAPLPSRCAP